MEELQDRLNRIRDWLADRYPSNCLPPTEREIDQLYREIPEAREWFTEERQ